MTANTTCYPARRPFRALPHVQPGVLESLLGRKPRENAWVAINNLLAEAPSIRDISPLDVIRICEEHRVDPAGPIAGQLERLYRDYLAFCLADRRLTETELCDLTHLKAVLRVGDRSAAAMHEAAVHSVYSCSVAEALADGVIDPAERAFLHQLQQDLGITAMHAARIESTVPRHSAGDERA